MRKADRDASTRRAIGWLVGLLCYCAHPASAAEPEGVAVRLPAVERESSESILPPGAIAIMPYTVGDSALTSGPSDSSFVARLAADPIGESIPTPPALAGIPSTTELPLEEVRESISRAYPLLIAVIQDRAIAAGEARSTRGAYDLHVQAENMAGAMGYYETNRAAVRAEQATLPGGKLWSGYRIGRGSFEPWYQERQTNDGGEFKLGYRQSLLQGLTIDKRRAAMYKADLALVAAESSIDKQRIYFLEYGAVQYWKWVAAGHWYLIQRDMLELAERRVAGIETRIAQGILPEIERLDNRRLVVSRQTKLIEADRKFQQEAVELSLYLRDAAGSPILPSADRLPPFPKRLPNNR